MELTDSAAVRIKELLSLRHKVPASLPCHEVTHITACRPWQLSRGESVSTSFHACLFLPHEHGCGEFTHDNTILDRSIVCTHLLLESSANRSEFRLLQVQEYIKLGVKQRGCNGLAYTMNYANEKGKFDEEVSEKGVRLLIEPSALMHIIGTKMDFVSDRLKYVILNGERPPTHDDAPQKLSIDF